MLYTAYFDESDTRGPQPNLILAALVGPTRQWELFGRKIRTLQRRDAFQVFHATEFRAAAGAVAVRQRLDLRRPQNHRVAVALNLVPCFTPVESPESNGMAEAFVKTFKRDYVRVNPLPDAAAALARIDSWMEDYNTVHPHSRLGYRSPGSASFSQPVACPV